MSRQLCRLFAGIEAFTVADITAATMRFAGGSATPGVREVRSSCREAPAPAAVAFAAARVRAVTGARHSQLCGPVSGQPLQIPNLPRVSIPIRSPVGHFLIPSGYFKHNLIPTRSNHTRETSHFITLQQIPVF
jgi:hypothetical protein